LYQSTSSQLLKNSLKDAFLCDLRVPFAIFAVKSSCFGSAHGKHEKLVTAKFAKNGRKERKERLSTSGGLDTTIAAF
jgi:hypothetical protein